MILDAHELFFIDICREIVALVRVVMFVRAAMLCDLLLKHLKNECLSSKSSKKDNYESKFWGRHT